MKSNAVSHRDDEPAVYGDHSASGTPPPSDQFGPAPVRDSRRQSLRMYTEEEVSEMLQVSLSQLRKWRIKQNQGSAQGPPFRKIGRLVRYPETALMEYVNRK